MWTEWTDMRVLYISDESPYLCERWLRLHAGEEQVCVLAPESSHGLVGAMRDKYPDIADAVVVSEAGARERVRALGVEDVSVPRAFKTQPLRYFADADLPRIAPAYPLFRQLWSLGFRSFDVVDLRGTQRLRVPYLLDAFRGRHKGQRCFVAGNGPSLNQIDMTLLKDEITLGANRCYMGYEDWGFPFTYWAIHDGLQIEEYGAEYETHVPADTVKFFPFEYLPFLRFENGCPVNVEACSPYLPKFSDSCDRVYMGSAVTYLLIQVAAVMGCDPIVLVGVDHRYPLKNRKDGQSSLIPHRVLSAARRLEERLAGTLVADVLAARRQRRAMARRGATKPADFWGAGDTVQPTHFSTQYVGGESKRFAMPHMKWAGAQFECAARWADEHGVRILNATPGSALEAFPLVAYKDLF